MTTKIELKDNVEIVAFYPEYAKQIEDVVYNHGKSPKDNWMPYQDKNRIKFRPWQKMHNTIQTAGKKSFVACCGYLPTDTPSETADWTDENWGVPCSISICDDSNTDYYTRWFKDQSTGNFEGIRPDETSYTIKFITEIPNEDTDSDTTPAFDFGVGMSIERLRLNPSGTPNLTFNGDTPSKDGTMTDVGGPTIKFPTDTSSHIARPELLIGKNTYILGYPADYTIDNDRLNVVITDPTSTVTDTEDFLFYYDQLFDTVGEDMTLNPDNRIPFKIAEVDLTDTISKDNSFKLAIIWKLSLSFN